MYKGNMMEPYHSVSCSCSMSMCLFSQPPPNSFPSSNHPSIQPSSSHEHFLGYHPVSAPQNQYKASKCLKYPVRIHKYHHLQDWSKIQETAQDWDAIWFQKINKFQLQDLEKSRPYPIDPTVPTARSKWLLKSHGTAVLLRVFIGNVHQLHQCNPGRSPIAGSSGFKSLGGYTHQGSLTRNLDLGSPMSIMSSTIRVCWFVMF